MTDDGNMSKHLIKESAIENTGTNSTLSIGPVVSRFNIRVTDLCCRASANNRDEEAHARASEKIHKETYEEAHGQVVSILENMSDGFLALDDDLVIRYFNKAAEQLLDRRREDVLGRCLFEVFPDSEESDFGKRFIRTLKEKKSAAFDTYFQPLENWYELRVHPYGEGMAVYFQVTTERRETEECLRRYRFHLEELVRERTAKLIEANQQLEREIAERVRTEKVLRESEQNFRRTFDQSPIGAAIVSTDYGFLRVNAELCRIIGYSEEELLSLSLSDISHPDDLSAERERAQALLAGKIDQFQIDTRYIRKSGETVWIRLSVRLVKDAAGRALYFLPMMEDITERKRMEEGLQRAQKLESLSILAGGIAHDFNNLLAAIIGNLSLAERQLQSESAISEIVREVKTASFQAKRLTQQLLTFAKGGAPIRKTASLSKLLKDTTSFLLRGSTVRYQLFIQEDLWLAEIDEGQVSQVIHNLVINASQAMPEGGLIEVRAENVTLGTRADAALPPREGKEHVMHGCVHSEPGEKSEYGAGHGTKGEWGIKAGKYIKISIRDHGVGIPEEYLNRIFDPYFTTKPKGSGLGLAVTYSIVKKHQGSIEVESRVGIGTSFTIYLPALEKEPAAAASDLSRRNMPSSLQSLYSRRGKILFMDDKPSIRDVVGRMLTHLKYEVELAKDGAEAIELYRKAKESEHPFDAVMLDLTVPGGMGGKDAIQKLLEIDPKIKAIVSSGYFNDPIMSDYRRYGFHGVVIKPYEVKELTETLSRVLRPERL
ncbi:MAG: PAS domain S-box protein [bacterium]